MAQFSISVCQNSIIVYLVFCAVFVGCKELKYIVLLKCMFWNHSRVSLFKTKNLYLFIKKYVPSNKSEIVKEIIKSIYISIKDFWEDSTLFFSKSHNNGFCYQYHIKENISWIVLRSFSIFDFLFSNIRSSYSIIIIIIVVLHLMES